MYKQIIDQIKPELDKTIVYLKEEFMGLQAGRAMPALVENLEVEAYDRRLALKELASIQAPEPRLIIIRPWDKNIIREIEKAINNSKLKLSASVSEDHIRVSVPPLSEERRKEMVKIVAEKIEECRISVRRHREEAWQKIQDLEKDKQITEDDKFKAKDELQKVIDEYNKKIDEMKKNKEEEIMRV